MVINLDPCLLRFSFYKVEVYGIFILLSVFLGLYFSLQDSARKKIISSSDHIQLLLETVLSGIVGARLLFVFSNLDYFFQNPFKVVAIWDGGLSLLGGLILAPVYLFFRLSDFKFKKLLYFDLLCKYLPLSQSVARLGCFFCGCCSGRAAGLSDNFTVVYKNPNSFAFVKNIPLLPTQLYSSFLSFLIFCFLFFISRIKKSSTGLIFFSYLFLEGLARFSVDFLRNDKAQDFIVFFGLGISWYQLISLFISLAGLLFIFKTILSETKKV